MGEDGSRENEWVITIGSYGSWVKGLMDYGSLSVTYCNSLCLNVTDYILTIYTNIELPFKSIDSL